MREALLFWRCNAGQGFLGALGVVLGIMGLVGASAIDAGARAELDQLAEDLGVGLVFVRAGEQFDAQAVARLEAALGDDLAGASVYDESQVPVRLGRTEFPAVRAVTSGADYSRTLGLDVVSGRFLSTADIERAYGNVVVSASLAARLSPFTALDGQDLLIDGTWMRVVGTVADERDGPTIYMPLGRGATADQIAVRLTSNDAIQANQALIERSAGRLLVRPESIEMTLPADALREEQQLRTLVSTILTVLSILVLVLGGMSVTNTMLMSVMTRRAEIALRRALGATTPEIILQFVLEAGVICAVGGIAAVVLATALISAAGGWLPWPVGVDLRTLLGTTIAISLVSLAAGGLPAWRAARVPPAEVLA